MLSGQLSMLSVVPMYGKSEWVAILIVPLELDGYMLSEGQYLKWHGPSR